MNIYKAIEKLFGKTVLVKPEIAANLEAILCDEPFVRNPDMPSEKRVKTKQLKLKI